MRIARQRLRKVLIMRTESEVAELLENVIANKPVTPTDLDFLLDEDLIVKGLDNSYEILLKGSEILEKYGSQSNNKEVEVKEDMISIQNLMKKEFPPIKWLIKDMIQEGTIGVIVAPRSSMKSWICQYMALCLTNGLSFLNKFETKQVKVLYIDMETSERNIQERANKILNGLGIKPQDNLFFKSFSKLRIDNKDNLEELIKVMKEKEISVLIIDTLKRIHNKQENQADSMNDLFTNYLRKLQIETNSTIILIHHTKKKPIGSTITDKMDMARGSNEIAGYVDWFYMIERKGRETFVKLSQEKSRFSSEVGVTGIKVSFDDNENKVGFEFVPETDWYVSEAPYTIKLISNWIAESNISSFATKDVKQYLKGINESDNPKSVSMALKTMEDKEIIKKIKQGKYEVLAKEDKQTKLP